MNVSEEIDTIKTAKAIVTKVYTDISRLAVCLEITEQAPEENDFSSLTAKEIIDKIRDHLKQEPSDVNSLIFLRYLAHFPVSLCKHDVSPLLRKTISIHYKLGTLNLLDITDLKNRHGIKPISYEELSEIFGRSKATINAYVGEAEDLWRQFQSEFARVMAIDEQQQKPRIENREETK